MTISTPTSSNLVMSEPTPHIPIPDDILCSIFPFLTQSDFIRCLRLSKHVHSLALPILYPILFGHISINVSQSDDIKSIDGKVIDHFKHPTRLGPLYEYTTHLTLTAHGGLDCQYLSSLVLPKLESLRIQPALKATKHPLWGSDHSGSSACHSGSNSISPNLPYCRLIEFLRPKRLILGGYTTGIGRSIDGLWSSSSSLPSSIEEVVILVGMVAEPNSEFSFLDQLPRSVRKVVFDMSFGESGWDQVEWTIESSRYDKLWDGYDADSVGKSVMRACVARVAQIDIVGERITLVNSEKFSERPSLPLFQKSLRKILEMSLRDKEKSLSEIRQRDAAVHFVDEKLFKKWEKEGWYNLAKAEWAGRDEKLMIMLLIEKERTSGAW